MRNEGPPRFPATGYTMPPGIAGANKHKPQTAANDGAALDSGFGRFIGTSPAMCALYQRIETAATREVPIFLAGEAGTGKGTCAEALHKHSARTASPFIAFNCQAAPHHQTRAALFDEGAGAFARARGGTLFLDDIAEMEPTCQGELLSFILQGRVESSHVRLVCATSRPVTNAVDSGLLREDLFNYLHVLPITVPPLRDRGRDVLDITHLLLRQTAARVGKPCADLDDEAAELLLHHDWPGNIRQLRNLVEQLVARHDDAMVTTAMLTPLLPQAPTAVTEASPARPPAEIHPAEAILFGAGTQIQPYATVERALIERAIQLCNGHVPRAAARLGLSPSTLYRKKAAWDGE